ncbi:putative transposase [Shigella sonnei 53G]|nr:putative transposase [Shigella sonnei 53G]
MPIIAPISRDERRLMQKAIHKTHDKNYARQTDCHADAAPGRTVSATLPERSAAPVPLLDAGLTGSRSRVLRD